MRSFSKRLSLFSLVAWLATVAYGATITGAVKGPDGEPMEGVFVQAQNLKTKITVSVPSRQQGSYRIENLPAGDYRLQIRAVGYRAESRTGGRGASGDSGRTGLGSPVSLAADQNVSFDFALQKAMVRWNEISMYQGKKLLPEAPGRKQLFGQCFACHGFETRMASVIRDEDGWHDRIQYMREAMRYFIRDRFTDQDENEVAHYLASLWGPDATLPKSPADVPGYKETLRPFKSEAMDIVYVEYELPGPNRMPWSGAPDKEGNVWIPYYGAANKIGRLNPKTGEVQEWPVPNRGSAGIHSAVAGPDGVVWITEQGSNKLAKWDPATQQVSEYQDTIGKHTVRIGPTGEVWFSGGKGSFNPETKKFTAYEGGAYGIALDQPGNAWYASGDDLVKVDAQTRKLTKYTPPTHENNFNRRIQVDTDGTVWFAEFNKGKMARFDPKTEKFQEYQLPGPEPTPYALGIDKNHYVWYSSEDMDVIGRLDPKTGDVLEYPFPHSENTMREFFYQPETGRMWFATPANNTVGYFVLAAGK